MKLIIHFNNVEVKTNPPLHLSHAMLVSMLNVATELMHNKYQISTKISCNELIKLEEKNEMQIYNLLHGTPQFYYLRYIVLFHKSTTVSGMICLVFDRKKNIRCV